jgi:hypothetical protein
MLHLTMTADSYNKALPQKLETGTHLVNGMKDQFLSLRSRREHKAWGVSARKLWFSSKSPRKRAKDFRNKGLSPVVTGCDR